MDIKLSRPVIIRFMALITPVCKTSSDIVCDRQSVPLPLSD
jgi:hypothetical protein